MSECPNYNDRVTSSTDNGDAVAHYLADIAGQLEAMARGANLELLAYLLAMARAEAEAIVLDERPYLHSPPH